MTPRYRIRRLLRFADWPIRYKLLIGVLLATVPWFVLGTAVFVAAHQDARLADAGDTLRGAAHTAALLVENALTLAQAEAQAISQDDALAAQVVDYALTAQENPDSPLVSALRARAQLTFGDVLAGYPLLRALRLLDESGRLLAVRGEDVAGTSAFSPYQGSYPPFIQARRTPPAPDEVLLVAPYPDLMSGALMLELITPIMDENEALLGYLVLTLDREALLGAPLAGVDAAFLGGAARLLLVDAGGAVLAGTADHTPDSSALAAIEIGRSGTATYAAAWGGETATTLSGYAPLASHAWTVIAELNQDAFLRPLLIQDIARSGIVFALIVLSFVLLILLVNRQLVRPLVAVIETARRIAAGDFTASLAAQPRADEIGQLADSFATMTEQLELAIGDLERRVVERTRALETTTLIGREISAARDLDTLLNRAVNLIRQNFETVYHAQVFLLDEAGEYAVLVASTGEPGRQLLARGHRLAVGGLSVIGSVTRLGETVVARDTATSRIHHKNEFLPETRAEMALPLRHGGQILGALDVQSTQAGVFGEQEQRVFEALADQLAVAIDNTRLFEETRRRATEIERLNRQLTREAWQEALAAARRQGVLDARAGADAGDDDWSPWQRQAVQRGTLVASPPQPDGTITLAAPVAVRGEVIGAVEWVLPAAQDNDHTRQMARDLVERLAVTLDNVRLREQSERLAARESQVSQLSGRLIEQADVAEILQTAVRELADILQTPQVSIHLQRPNGAPQADPANTESA